MNRIKSVLGFLMQASQSRTTAFLVILVIGAAIPLTVLVAQKQQQYQQQASGASCPIGQTINGKIYSYGGPTCDATGKTHDTSYGDGVSGQCCYDPAAAVCPIGQTINGKIYSYVGPTCDAIGKTHDTSYGDSVSGQCCYAPATSSGGGGGASCSGTPTVDGVVTTYTCEFSSCSGVWRPSQTRTCTTGGTCCWKDYTTDKSMPAPDGSGTTYTISKFLAYYQPVGKGEFTVNQSITVPINHAVGVNWVSNAPSCAVQSDTGSLWNTNKAGLPASGDNLMVAFRTSIITIDCGGTTQYVTINVTGTTGGAAVSCTASTATTTIGHPITFTATGGDNVNYAWNIPSSSSPTQTGKTVTATYQTTGTYSAIVTSGGQPNSCTAVTVTSGGGGAGGGNVTTCSLKACENSSCEWINLGRSNVATCITNAHTYANCIYPPGTGGNSSNDLFNTIATLCKSASGTGTAPLPVATGTTLALSIGLSGVGSVGDRVNPSNASSSNKSPKSTLAATVTLFSGTTQVGGAISAALTYNSSSGKFEGPASLPGVAAGSYTVKVSALGHLRKSAGTVNIVINQSVPTSANLFAGDIDADNDIDIFDHKILLGCSIFASPAQKVDCVGKQSESDLNLDGKVDQYDYNLFLRDYGAQTGD